MAMDQAAEQEVEYLLEWPPPKSTQNSFCSPEGQGSKKRLLTGTSDIHNNVKRLKSGHGAASMKLVSCPVPSPIDSLITSNTDLMPDTILSRWWKGRSKGVNSMSFTTLPASEGQKMGSNNPRTLLHQVASLPEAQDIILQRIAYLQGRLSEVKDSLEKADHTIHFNLASCYHLQSSGFKHTSCALKHAQKALDLCEDSGEIKWLIEQLVRQRDAEEKQLQIREKHLSISCDLASLSMPKPIQVERRFAATLSLKEFIEEYALKRIPLVIMGLTDQMMVRPWTLNYIKEVIGHRVAPLKRMVRGSVEWARLESAGQCIIRDFIESLDNEEELRYLFDWSLPLNCPELATELSIPKYFMNDFLQRAPEGSLYRDSWPSLFIAPAGITSELHVDAFASNFWMALFEGRKRWVFFPPEDTPLLYPVYSHSTDATFQSDLSSPDLSAHPLLAFTHPRVCVLHPGEVLYVPFGCPHHVENLEKSLAISANFVDCSNFEQVKRELSASASIDEQANCLLSVFQDDGFDATMREDGELLNLDLTGVPLKLSDEAERGMNIGFGKVKAIDSKLNCPNGTEKLEQVLSGSSTEAQPLTRVKETHLMIDSEGLCLPWAKFKLGVHELH